MFTVPSSPKLNNFRMYITFITYLKLYTLLGPLDRVKVRMLQGQMMSDHDNLTFQKLWFPKALFSDCFTMVHIEVSLKIQPQKQTV